MSETQMLSYKYRLYPNAAQRAAFDRALSIGWRIYNDALRQRIEHYRATGEGLTWQTQQKLWGEERRAHPELQTLPFDTVGELIRRLDKAYQAFFQRRAQGVGFPKEQRRRDFSSLDYRYGKGCKLTPTSAKRARLYLMSVGDLKVHMHRPLPLGARIKRLTVMRQSETEYYVAVQIECAAAPAPVHTGGRVGIDLGLKYLLAFSDDMLPVPHPAWHSIRQRQRRVIGRKLDRQRRAANPQNFNENGTVKEGVFIWRKSNRQRVVESAWARHEAKLARQRRHFWDTATTYLTRTYSVIALEALTLDFMQKNHRTARQVYDAGFGMFWSMLKYKAERTGTRLVFVEPQYTSQTCSACGYTAAENRRTQADFTCVECGYYENADINAAKNILERARLKLLWE